MSANIEKSIIAPRFDLLKKLPEFEDKGDIKSIFAKIRSGNVSEKNKFITSNLKLVRRVANRFMGNGVDLEDLFSAGVLGLSHAINKFDEDRNIRFSTYAVPWITDYMRQEVAKNSHSVHVPTHVTKASKKCQKAYYDLLKRLDREPTYQEIADKTEFGIESIGKLLMLNNIEISGSSPLGSDDSSVNLMDTMSYEEDNLERDVEDDEMGKYLIDLASKLDYKMSVIIVHRFGLGGNEPKTLKEVGEILNLTRERIRQLEQTALMAMKCMLEREGMSLADLINK